MNNCNIEQLRIVLQDDRFNSNNFNYFSLDNLLNDDLVLTEQA